MSKNVGENKILQKFARLQPTIPGGAGLEPGPRLQKPGLEAA